MDELIYDFGELPESVGFGNYSSVREQLKIGVEFRLKLWSIAKNQRRIYQLRYSQRAIEWPADAPVEYLRVNFIRPAIWPGLSTFALKSTAQKPQITLLQARYEDLEWMRATAQKLGELFDIVVEENDWGEDD